MTGPRSTVESGAIAQRVLPILQRAVAAQIQEWEAESEIERVLGHEIGDVLGEQIKTLAVGADVASSITIADVRAFLEAVR